jgi:mRNA guanylyltransferase
MTTVQEAMKLAYAEIAPSYSRPPPPSFGQPLLVELELLLTHVHCALCNGLSSEEKAKIDNGTCAVEIEARLGLIQCRGTGVRATPFTAGAGVCALDGQSMKQRNWEFVGGVGRADYQDIVDIPSQICTTSKSKDIVYTYPQGKRLVIVNSETRRWEQKVQKLVKTFLSPSSPYDIRVTVSLEEQIVGDMHMIPPEWISKRDRQRRSCCNLNAQWTLDTTTVHTQWSDDLRKECSLEIELELQAPIQRQWMSEKSDSVIGSMTQHLSRNLSLLLQTMNPSSSAHQAAVPVPQETCVQVIETVKNMCSQLRSGGKFPGAMPVNMCLHHISSVQQDTYFVCEKTDGVRYLLVTLQKDAVFLDRTMQCNQVLGGGELANAVPETVLDGELVRVQSESSEVPRAVFVIFDILMLEGKSLMSHAFSQRFQLVSNVVMPRYNAANCTALLLQPKQFYRRADIGALMSCVKQGKGMQKRDRVYVQAGSWHRTDGVILQPDTKYGEGCLLKWKYPDLASIDLRAANHYGVISFTTDTKDGSQDVSTIVKLASHDTARVLADIGHEASGMIVEVAHDRCTGLWRYIGLRSDKKKPNFITTVMSTLLEIAENISEAELVFRLTSPTTDEDEWNYHADKMAKKLKDWQLGRFK